MDRIGMMDDADRTTYVLNAQMRAANLFFSDVTSAPSAASTEPPSLGLPHLSLLLETKPSAENKATMKTRR